MDTLAASSVEATTLKGQLLLVDDDQNIARVLSVGLQMADYAVQTAASVFEAREYLTNDAVDLVITDWELPDGTGADVCLAARAVDRFMPVIMISAVISRGELGDVECHGEAYLEKPVDLHLLRMTIRRLLDLRRDERVFGNHA